MEKKINVAKLLKDCPSGMELDCTICNNVVTLEGVDKEGYYPIRVMTKSGYHHRLTCEGYVYEEEDAKCVIYPKGKTTWEGFHRPFKDGDIVVYDNPHRNNLQVFIFKNKKENNTLSSCYLMLDGDELDLEEGMYYVTRLATEEEKQKLFKAIKDYGYKWNSETKTLERIIEQKFKVGDNIRMKGTSAIYVVTAIREDRYMLDDKDISLLFKTQDQWELVPNKFDINTLVPFESKVLVRDGLSYKWLPAIWGFYNEDGCDWHYEVVGGNGFSYCIPYEGNEHLLGTTNDCDEFYKTW